MPLFVCDQCHSIESTATSTFSKQLEARAAGQRRDLLCSECESGSWHDVFPKQRATRAYVRANAHAFLYTGAYTERLESSLPTAEVLAAR